MFVEHIRKSLAASGAAIALGLIIVQSVVDASSTLAPMAVPSTTVVTSTTAPTTSLLPKRVEGSDQREPTTTVGGTAVEGAVLARSGANAIPLVIGGVVFVLVGTAMLGVRKGALRQRGLPAPR